MSIDALHERIIAVRERMAQAATRSAFGQKVKLIAVSKKQPASALQNFLDLCGKDGVAVAFGENYVQEWAEKRSCLSGSWTVDLIGPLQSNKTARAVRLFDTIQSVHSEKILALINHEAGKIDKVQRVFLQVNISRDESKSGFHPGEVEKICSRAKALSHIAVSGVMTITRDYESSEMARPDFRALRTLRDRLDPTLELSMGMSGDFEVAVEEGASVVRIGTALFGPRDA